MADESNDLLAEAAKKAAWLRGLMGGHIDHATDCRFGQTSDECIEDCTYWDAVAECTSTANLLTSLAARVRALEEDGKRLDFLDKWAGDGNSARGQIDSQMSSALAAGEAEGA